MLLHYSSLLLVSTAIWACSLADFIVPVAPDQSLKSRGLTGFTGRGTIKGSDVKVKSLDDWPTLLGWACEAGKSMNAQLVGAADDVKPKTMVVGRAGDELIFGSSIKGAWQTPDGDMAWLDAFNKKIPPAGDPLAQLATDYKVCQKGEKARHPFSAKCGEFSVYQQVYQVSNQMPWSQNFMAAAVQVKGDPGKETCEFLKPCGRAPGAKKGLPGCGFFASFYEVLTPPLGSIPRTLSLKSSDYVKRDPLPLVGRREPLPACKRAVGGKGTAADACDVSDTGRNTTTASSNSASANASGKSPVSPASSHMGSASTSSAKTSVRSSAVPVPSEFTPLKSIATKTAASTLKKTTVAKTTAAKATKTKAATTKAKANTTKKKAVKTRALST